MKKIVLLLLFAAIISGSLLAQTATQTSTISGTLGLTNGRISVASGNITYYVIGLQRFVGFIDGLNYGTAVTLEGYSVTPRVEGQTNRVFYPVKLTLGGRDYEIGSPLINSRARMFNERMFNNRMLNDRSSESRGRRR